MAFPRFRSVPAFFLGGVMGILTLLLPGPAGKAGADAATVSLSVTVDKTHLSLDDTLELSVRINGTQKAPPPALPPLPEFRVEGRGTSTSLKVVNGARTESITYHYLLTPQKTGTFEIGPVKLVMNGQTYESPPIQLTVTPQAQFPDGEAPVFAEAEISNPNPYVQEQVRLTFRLYRKVEAVNIGLEVKTDHFRKVSLGEAREYSRIVNGVRYYVHEKSFALFPMREGRWTIPPAAISLDLVHRPAGRPSPFDLFDLPHPGPQIFDDPFLGGRVRLERKNLRTRALEVTVKPLPAKGRPADFSRLVGQFQLTSKLSKTRLEAGDTTTWTLTLSGRGNLTEAVLPPLPPISALKVYADQPHLEEEPRRTHLEGRKIFNLALVPIRPGNISLPEITLSYFDPEREAYQTLKVPSQTLQVDPAPTAGGSASPAADLPGSGKPDGSELLPIHTDPEMFRAPYGSWMRPGVWIAAFLLPPLTYLGIRVTLAHRRRLQYDRAFARRREARQRAEEGFKQLEACRNPEPRRVGRELSRIIRDYLGDRLDLPGAACTPEELEQKLRERGFPGEMVAAVRQLLDRCEELEFAAVPHGPPEDLVSESRELINRLEAAS